MPNKRMAQIILFAVGFIFPPGNSDLSHEHIVRLLTAPKAWFVAAFLPLPPRPTVVNAKGKDVTRQTQVLEDLEKQLGAVDEARYENARWWRIINRIISGFGVLIIVAIIALVTVDAS